MRYFFTVLLCALLWPLAGVFAAVIKGKVTDDKGEPLPFATVYVKGSTIGTAANAQAEYNFSLGPGNHTIICQYIGYQQTTFRLDVKGDETITHNFSLREQSLTMNSVVVKANAEDPAYAIIRKAIKRRKFHQEQVRAFQTSIYMKAVIRNRSLPKTIFGAEINGKDLAEAGGGGADSTKLGVIYLSEQEADYYSRGAKERTIIRSVRESGNPNGVGISRMPPVVSFYDNNVNPLWNLSERGFISPISDGALNFYRYRYEGEFIENGHTINKIAVIPKRDYEPLFSGTIYIVEKDWAVHSLNLTLTKRSNLQELDTLHIRQTYLPLAKDTWVIKNQVQLPTLRVFGFDFAAYFIAVYDGQKVNEPIPDSLFENKVVSSYLSEAQDKDTTHWKEMRAVPLEDDEKQDYHKRDSVYARITSPAYLDSMRRVRNKFRVGDILTGGVYYSSKGNKQTFKTNSLLDGLLHFNTVEGLMVGPRVWFTQKVDSYRYISNVVAMRYGFRNTHFNLHDKLSYRIYDPHWLQRRWDIGIEGGKYVFQFNPRSSMTQLYNTFTTLTEGRNLYKIYERYTAAAFVERKVGNGWNWKLKAGFQQRIPLSNTTFYTWANKDKTQWTDNVPTELSGYLWEKHNAVLAKAEISYQPGVRYIQYPRFKSPVSSIWPVFTATYEKGIPGLLNSKVDFDKWKFSITDYVNMKLLGSIEYNLALGGFLNKNYVSLPDMMHVADNRLVLAAPYLQSFQLAPYYRFSNIAPLYAEGHIEYNLNGLLSNKVPLLKKARWNIVTGSNTLFISDKDYYTEVFVGIDNLGFKIFRFFRIDAVRGWDDTRKTFSGIRIGIDAAALSGMGGVVIDSDTENFDW